MTSLSVRSIYNDDFTIAVGSVTEEPCSLTDCSSLTLASVMTEPTYPTDQAYSSAREDAHSESEGPKEVCISFPWT